MTEKTYPDTRFEGCLRRRSKLELDVEAFASDFLKPLNEGNFRYLNPLRDFSRFEYAELMIKDVSLKESGIIAGVKYDFNKNKITPLKIETDFQKEYISKLKGKIGEDRFY